MRNEIERGLCFRLIPGILRAMEAPHVIEWLERMANFQGDYSLERWLLEHGKPMGPRIELPFGVQYGKAKECFGNAFLEAAYKREHLYCEGFAYTPNLIACHHAWLINDSGEVIDPTWRDGGNECCFCEGGILVINQCIKHEVDIEECGCDEDEVGYYEGEEVKCLSCNGTGVSEFDHPSREGTEYFGIVVDDTSWLVKAVLEQGVYGILPQQIQNLSMKV